MQRNFTDCNIDNVVQHQTQGNLKNRKHASRLTIRFNRQLVVDEEMRTKKKVLSHQRIRIYKRSKTAKQSIINVQPQQFTTLLLRGAYAHVRKQRSLY